MTTLVTTDDYATIDALVAANLTDDIQYQLLTDIAGGDFTGLPAGITVFTENDSKITSDVISRTEGLALFRVDITGNLSGDNIRIEDSHVNGDYILSLDLNELHLIMTIGNSHTSGRSDAEAGDVFDSRVLQYAGSTNIIGAPVGAQLDHNDLNQGTGEYSKDLAFSSVYLENNSQIDNIVFVPYAQGASGFSFDGDPEDINWNPLLTPNRLSEAVERFNTAKAQLEADGFTVTFQAVLWHNANPDFNRMTHQEHQEAIDGFVDYLRANINDGADIPVVIGGGMMQEQIDTRIIEDTRFQANLTGAGFRRPNVMGYDNTNPQYGFSEGLPLTIFDGIHCDRRSEEIKGRDLQYPALLRATEKNNVSGVFESLSFWNDFHSFFDFRSGTGLDLSGNGNHLIDLSFAPALITYDEDTQQTSYTHDGSNNRYFEMSGFPTGSYTKVVFLKLSDYRTMGLMQDSTAPTDDQNHRFQISGTGSLITAGQGDGTQLSAASSLIPLNTYTLACVTYDSNDSSMNLTIGDTVVDTASGVPSNDIVTGFLGTQSDGGGNVLDGSMTIAGFVDRALTITEIQELNAACQTLIV